MLEPSIGLSNGNSGLKDLIIEHSSPRSYRINLNSIFDIINVEGTVIRFNTNVPTGEKVFYVELALNTPQTNANFLSYVNSGDYDDTVFHRSISDFVIQGGGFSSPTVPADQPGRDPVTLAVRDTVQNEPGNPNNRGTIAMAKLGDKPDSATSQFFFNLNNKPQLVDNTRRHFYLKLIKV